MMTQTANGKSLRRLLMALFTVVIGICFVVGIVTFDNSSSATAEKPIVINQAIKDTYSKNETIEFPAQTTVSVDGNEYSADFLGIKFPNGTVYAYNTCEVSKAGTYSVLYSYKAAGTTLVAEKSFVVNDKFIADFVGSSELTYGDLTYLSQSSDYKQGLTLTLAEGDTFTFNQVLDLRTTPMYELIHFFPTQYIDSWYALMNKGVDPETGNKITDYLDVKYINLVLTDAYDSSNKVTLLLRFYPVYTSRQMTASTDCDGQGPTAIEKTTAAKDNYWSTYSQCEVNGQRYYVWSVNGLSNSPHRGVQVQDLVGNSTKGAYNYDLSWILDYETNQAFFSNNTETEEKKLDKTFSGGKLLISDLDDPNITTTGAFKGFTTGEVYLSISGTEYLKSSTTIEIGAIGGYSGAALQNLTSVDSVAPVIEIDSGLEAYNGVTNEKFKIFDSKVIDTNYIEDATVLVYYNYGTDIQTLVNVSNGAFIPTASGKYSIVYTAKDAFGNSTTKIIPVNVTTPTSLTGNKGININVDKLSALVTGSAATLATPTFSSYNDEVVWSVEVTKPDGTVITLSDALTFVPSEVGTYKVKYVYSDSAYSYNYSYSLTCTASNTCFYLDSPNVGKYYLKYANYTLDDVYAYKTVNGKLTQQLAKLYVSQDGGEFTEAVDYKFEVTGNSSISFKFVCDGVESDVYAAQIKDVGYKQKNPVSNYSLFAINEYFVGDFDSGIAGNGIGYISNVIQGENSMEFIRSLIGKNFSLKFNIPEDCRNISAMNIYLTDVKDASNVVKLSISYKYYHTYFSLNDGIKYDVSRIESNTFIDDITWELSYQPSAKRFACNSGSTTSYIDFDGVVPEEVYLSIEFVDITGKAGVEIYNVWDQMFNADEDRVEPSYSYVSSSGRYNYGETVTVYHSIVGDVLSPVSSKDVKISVVDVNGNYVSDVNGLELKEVDGRKDYQFVAVQTRYNVNYTGLKDGWGKTASTSYLITVVDSEKPVIAFEDGSNEDTVVRISLGSTLKVKDFTVTDNKSTEDKLNTQIFIIDGNGMWCANVTETKEYRPARKGSYQVKIISVDEAKNMGVAYYRFIVE